jgi:hypothetical protein
MLLPVGTARGPLAGAVEFRAILARTRKPRTLFAAAVVARAIEARLVETAPALACGTCITPATIIPLLPRLVLASLGTIAIVLSGTTIRRAARELLVAAEFSLGPIRTGTIAIARRPGAIGPIATRTVAVLAKTFATRCVGSLLAAAFARGIWLPVAELSIGRTPGRTRIVAIPRAALAIPIPPRRTVVAVETGTIAARLERALLTTATIFTRLERAPFAIVTA